jgi:hypothetical protein
LAIQVPGSSSWQVLSDIQILQPLGSGNFGAVYKGMWQGTTEVAL